MTGVPAWELLEWRQPLWLLLALQPVLLLALRRLWRWRHRRPYADPALLPWVLRRADRSPLRRVLSRTTAHGLAWVLLAVAAAGPRVAEELPGQSLRDGARVLIAVDLSRSMVAADVVPSRIKRARIELLDLFTRARVDRFGLLPFAGRAHLLVPPTGDYGALRHYVDSLQPGLLPTAGSNLGGALERAHRLLAADAGAAAVLLVSDGEASGDQQDLSAARALGAAGIPVYVLGVGTVEGASLPAEGGDWLEHEGRAVISRLQPHALEALARVSGGAYATVADDDSEWQRLYDRGIATLASHRIAAADAERIHWHALYPWALVPGLVLLALSLIPLRRRAAPVAVAFLVTVATFGVERPVAAADAEAVERRAYAALQDGDYVRARDAYGRLSGYAARMGEGVASYRLRDSGQAAAQFAEAVLAADDDAQRARALYNLGNSRFQDGDYAAAVEAYRDALRYRSEYPAARTNLALAQELDAAVRARLARTPPRAPPGRGPRPGDGDAEGGRFIMEPTPMPEPEGEQALPELPQTDDGELAALIARGLRHARQAVANDTQSSAAGPSAAPEDLGAARARARRLQSDLADYWRGLFSFEEGFPASVDAPRPMPGVTPW